jgi:hypothetical protein
MSLELYDQRITALRARVTLFKEQAQHLLTRFEWREISALEAKTEAELRPSS